MAGNIQNVNLAKLKSEIDEYTKIASDLHQSVTDICSNMKKFSTCWSGQTVNRVIEKWNQNYKQIDEAVFYLAMKIKLILLEIYDQYSAMEKGTPKDSGYGYGWGGIMQIPLTNSSTIKFDQAKVKVIQKNIEADYNKAKADLKNLVTKLNSMQEYSDSLKVLVSTYTNNANICDKNLTELCNIIISEIQKSISDVSVTEGYNEKDVKRASSTSKN